MKKRDLLVAATFAGAVTALLLGSSLLHRNALAAGVQAPQFEVDPFWPKPLPNHWVMGMTIGVSVDAQDHVWIVHRSGSNDPGEQHNVAAAHPDVVARLKAAYDRVIDAPAPAARSQVPRTSPR